MSDIFREVDEDIRQEQLTVFVKDYGKYAIAIIIALIALYGGYNYWQDTIRVEREAASERFSKALTSFVGDNSAHAIAEFAAIAEVRGNNDYGLLSKFRQAEALIASDEIQAAVNVYDSLATETDLDPFWRSMAGFFGTVALLESGNVNSGMARLDGLAVQGAPLRLSALEMKAMYQYASGRMKNASKNFQTILAEAPQGTGFRTRATQMLAIIARETGSVASISSNNNPGTE